MDAKKIKKSPARRGRPRQFDAEQALDAAMKLFWRRGYEGTTLAALAEAMAINLPSLYAAFGNKETLFRRAVERYLEGPASYLPRALQQPTARQVAEEAFRGAIEMVAPPEHADGCLLVHGALAAGPAAEPIRAELSRRRQRAEAAVCQRFERSIAEGDLPAETDAAALARYLMTVIWGLSVQAAGGATRQELTQVAQTTLACWPSGLGR